MKGNVMLYAMGAVETCPRPGGSKLIMVMETGSDFDDATQTNDLQCDGCKRRNRQQVALRARLMMWRREVRQRVERREEADIRENDPAA